MIEPDRGDVVRSTDPFKLGNEHQRPWLVVSDDRHPFADEQVIAVAVSTSEYEQSIPLVDCWEVGGVPRESYASPWAVHSPRIEDFVGWQGRVAPSFVDRVVEKLTSLIE